VLRIYRGNTVIFKAYQRLALPQKALFGKYGAALFALPSFFVERSSPVSAASAIVSNSPFGLISTFVSTSPFSAGACAAVVDECNQIIQTAHGTVSLNILVIENRSFRFLNHECGF
jgi:hypothetical protein